MSNLNDLPNELIAEICEFLDVRNLAKFARTNKKCNRIASVRISEEFNKFKGSLDELKKLMEEIPKVITTDSTKDKVKEIKTKFDFLINRDTKYLSLSKKVFELFPYLTKLFTILCSPTISIEAILALKEIETKISEINKVK